MATTAISTTKPKQLRSRTKPAFRFSGHIDVAAPHPIGGRDSVCTLLPTAAELAEYLHEPQLAVEMYCLRTGACLVTGVLAFRALFPRGGAA